MNWFALSILSGLAFAASRTISRVALKAKGDALAFTTVNDFIAGIVLLPFLWTTLQLPERGVTWIFFICIVLFAFFSDWLAFVALKHIGVSLYQILNQVRHVFILLGGLLVFSEPITGTKTLSILLIIVGVVVVMWERARMHWSRGATLTVLSTLAAVAAFLFAKLIVKDFSVAAVTSFELMAIGFVAFDLIGFRPRRIAQELRLNKWWLIISGLLFGVFELTLFTALRLGEVSKVIPVTQVSLIFAVAFGVLFLRERERLAQKIVWYRGYHWRCCSALPLLTQ